MKNWIIRFPLLLVIGFFSSQETSFAQERHTFQPESFEEEERADWQKVEDVIHAMDLRPGHSVADIGGGSGYFSRPFARTVGPDGIVYCCDIAPNLLEYLQNRALVEGLSNIVTVLAARDRPMLPPKSVDCIFFCNTNHHLENRVDYYKGLIPLLKEGGQIVVVDWKKVSQKVGPPPSHCVARDVVIAEMAQAGLKLSREIPNLLEYQYFLIFQPDPSQK